jgi:hypothetical protein
MITSRKRFARAWWLLVMRYDLPGTGHPASHELHLQRQHGK